MIDSAAPAYRRRERIGRVPFSTKLFQGLGAIPDTVLGWVLSTFVLLFYNPAGADDQAMKQELGGVSTHRGKVFKLAIPLSELPNYTAVTDQVPVNFSPTLVVIARSI